jgi:adenine-specific DNA methylase
MVTPEEFSDWKSNIVTQEFFKAADARVEDAKEILASSAGQDSVNDSYLRGFIQAYREMREFRVDD